MKTKITSLKAHLEQEVITISKLYIELQDGEKFYPDLYCIRGAEYKESDERKERKRTKILRGQRKKTGTRK